MFSVIAWCDLYSESFGTYRTREEAESVLACIDDDQLPDRCIEVSVCETHQVHDPR